MPVTINAAGTTADFDEQRALVSTSTGRLWCATITPASNCDFYRSDNGGTSWTEETGLRVTLPALPTMLNLFCDQDDNLHVHAGTTVGSLDYYWNVRAGATSPSATISWSGQAGSMVAFRHPTAAGFYLVEIAYGTPSPFTTKIRQIVVQDTGASPLVNTDSGAVYDLTVTSSVVSSTHPSIDFYHTGDGKTPVGNAPHLFVAWNESANGVVFRKLTWIGTGWSVGSASQFDANTTSPNGGHQLVFDGVQVMCVYARTADTSPRVAMRDAGDTITNGLTPPALADGDLQWGLTCTYDNLQNFYIACVGATSRDLKQIKLTRSPLAWDVAWTLLEAGTFRTPTYKRGQFRQGADVAYTDTVSTLVRFNRTVINTAPTAPTWVGSNPANGGTVDVAVGLPLAWVHNDADGDPQTQYRLVRSLNGGALQEWTGAAWAAPTQIVVTGTNGVTIPAGAGTLGSDGNTVDFWVYTYDGVAWSPISIARHYVLSAKNNPTITAPVGTVTTPTTTATWTVAEQTAKRVRLYADAGLTNIVWDSGWETSAVASRTIDYTLTDGTTYWLTVETQNNEGLASNVISGTFAVDYTEPAVAWVWTESDVPSGGITVHVVNPAASGTVPAAATNELWVRVSPGLDAIGNPARADGDRPVGGNGIRIASALAPNVAYVDWAAASTFLYEYRVRTIGVTGAVVWSEWSLGDESVGALLAGARLHLSALSWVGSGPWSNIGTWGSAMNATPGALGAAPTLRPWTADSYASFPGLAGSYASTPNKASLAITGDLELVVRVNLADYTAVGNQTLMGRFLGTSSYLWRVLSTGDLAFAWAGGSGSVAGGLVDGTTYWLKMTRSATTGIATFYKAADAMAEPTVWTTIGAVATAAGLLSAGADPLEIGARGGGATDPATGAIYRAIVRNGIGGTTVADFNAASWTAGSTLTSAGDVWTLIGPRMFVIDAPAIEFDGTNDLFDFLADPFGAYVNLTGASGTYISTPDSNVLDLISSAGGPSYLLLAGIAANNASTPSSAVLNVGGDLTLDMKVRLNDYTDAIAPYLISKWGAVGNRSWALYLAGDGKVHLVTTPDGTTQLDNVSSVAIGTTDGNETWVRASLDVNDGAGNRVCKFYTSTDGQTWSQLGTTATTAGATSIFASTAAVVVGDASGGGSAAISGRVFQAKVSTSYLQAASGVGFAALDCSFEAQANGATTFVCATGQTITVNVSGGYPAKIVAPTAAYLQLNGTTGNWASCPHAAAVSFTTGTIEQVVRVKVNDYTDAVRNQGLISKFNGTASWLWRLTTTGEMQWLTAVGNYTSVGAALTDGVTYWLRVVHVTATGATTFYKAADQETEPVTWTTISAGNSGIGALSAGTDPVSIGANSAGTDSLLAGRIYRAILRTALATTPVMDVSFGAQATGATSFVCESGQTISVLSAGGYPAKVIAPTNAFLAVPAIGGNYASIPDGASVDITGDIEMILRIKFDSIGQSWVLSKGNAYGIYFTSTNIRGTALGLGVDADGGAHGLVAGTTYWLRVTRVSATGAWSFYKANDQETEPTVWTTITAGVAATAGALQNTNDQLRIGGEGSGFLRIKRVYRTILRTTIGGQPTTTTLDVDFTHQVNGAASFTALTGQTVTVTTTGSAEVARIQQLSTDITLDVKAALSDWTPAATTALVSKWTTTGNNQSFTFYVEATSGLIHLAVSIDGVNYVDAVSTAAPVIADGATKWLRASMDVDDGAGNRVIKFYTSDDGITWAQLGATVTTAGITAIRASAAVLELGTNQVGTFAMLTGKVFNARVFNTYLQGAVGTPVAQFDAHGLPANAVAPDSYSNGEVWTLNGGASVLLGNPMNFRNNADFTVVVIGQLTDSTNQGVLIGKRSSAAAATVPGWTLREEAGTTRPTTTISDSAVAVADAATAVVPQRTWSSIAGVRDGAVTINTTVDGAGVATADTTTKTISSTQAARLGAFGAGLGTSFAPMLVKRVLMFDRVLTVAEQQLLASALA